MVIGDNASLEEVTSSSMGHYLKMPSVLNKRGIWMEREALGDTELER